MSNRPDIEFVATTLAQVVRRRQSPEERFARALKLRQDIRDAIRAGTPPTEHYRYLWVQQQAVQLLELLGMMSQDFDKAHPDDTCTALDLYDVVKAAEAWLLQEMKKRGYPMPAPPEEKKSEPVES